MMVHQLIPSFGGRDASGQAALHLQFVLRRMGLYGELYADEVKDGLTSLAQPASRLVPAQDDLVLYHHGIGSGMSARLMHLRCRRGVIYHNISPVEVYRDTGLAEHLAAGRAQLAAMARHVELAVGVSDFNSAELTEAGYRNVHTVPLFVEPARFQRSAADGRLLARLQGAGPVLMTVSRVLPHKRFEDLIALHRQVLRLRPSAKLLLVGGYAEGEAYYRKLKALSRGLAGVHFLGRLSHAELVAAYRAGTVFVSMSEHEGFGVPLIEAMAAELPVLAFAAAAVPETLGGHGIAFTQKNYPLLAELAVELTENVSLRAPILEGQSSRLKELSAEATQRRLEAALQSLTPPVVTAKRTPTRKKKPHVAVLVQRFGEVSGGAERLAEMVAERLLPHFKLTVLTTCAKDHLSWKNEFPAGPQTVGPFHVLRFPTVRPRNLPSFNALSRKMFGTAQDRVSEERWVAEQGPVVPELLRHLSTEQARYDAFIGFTYLYAPMALGLPMVASRALVVPTAHDEPPFAFDIFADVFERPRALLCLTPEELALIHRRFPRHARARVVGAGVDLTRGVASRFGKTYGQHRPYLLYVGRIEEGKNLAELLRFHRALLDRDPEAPDLLFAGSGGMRIEGPRVRMLGRISEEDKRDGLAGAVAAVIPSRFESLSLLALEAFSQGTPILVNGASDVLVGQANRSGAGRTYANADEFAEASRALASERKALRPHALAFAREHTWDKVVAIYREELGLIIRN